MRFVGRVAIIVLLALGAAVAHSLYVPVNPDPRASNERALAAARQARQADGDTPPTHPPAQQDAQPDAAGEQAQPDPDPGPDPQPVPAAGGDLLAPAPAPASDEGAGEDLPSYYISVERAYELWNEGAFFIDARTDSEREAGWVQDAEHLETKMFVDGSAQAVLERLDPALPVVVYCGGGDCDASENVAARLIQSGFTDLYVMHEGYGAWRDAGHPVTMPDGGEGGP